MRTNGYLFISGSAALTVFILVLHVLSNVMAATHGAVG